MTRIVASRCVKTVTKASMSVKTVETDRISGG